MSDLHTFHIPVMGLGFTIDTPIKVAPFGINSVISIVDDILIEQMREYYCHLENIEYVPITKNENDFRAKRITSYLNLIDEIIKKKFAEIKSQEFTPGSDITKYFEYLPSSSSLKSLYNRMLSEEDKELKSDQQKKLRELMRPGTADVNIMTKVDSINYSPSGEALPEIYSDALAALRGYANSNLNSSIIFSAGLNPRLYSYCETFEEFYPLSKNESRKKIILKVSDYRSAYIQGKFFAKKGLWVSEFRIESGLNCGGHAFATEGKLLGPIIEEFKNKKQELSRELFKIYNEGLLDKGHAPLNQCPPLKITVQGGIGTNNEDRLLLDYYEVDGTGWGSPFLLVPEVTNVDEETLQLLATAKKEDYYISDASPLGVPFNNFRNTSSHKQREKRIEKNRPGSPCNKKYLMFNSEFTDRPICTASREYQNLKLMELNKQSLSPSEFKEASEKIMEKECLCEGLAAAALITNKILKPRQLKAVTICPGPNLAYFSGIFSLKEMIDHIYGRITILNSLDREHMFINELQMYAEYLKKEIQKCLNEGSHKQIKYLQNFKSSLLEGVDYYKGLFRKMKIETEEYKIKTLIALNRWENYIVNLRIPELEVAH